MSRRKGIWLQQWNNHTNQENLDKSYYLGWEFGETLDEGKEFKRHNIEKQNDFFIEKFVFIQKAMNLSRPRTFK